VWSVQPPQMPASRGPRGPAAPPTS
jgi:hypothetical protein